MAQLIFNLLLRVSIKSFAFKLLLKLRELLVQINPDGIVNYPYKKFVLQFPFSHDYPINLRFHPNYSENLGKIASVVSKKHSDTKAIDVGANIGDSAAIIQSYTSIPILCIEGNPKFIPMLKENTKQLSNISIEQSFVGERNERVVAINNLGTARLERSDNGIEVKTMEEILLNHEEFQSAKLLKIDTDGFDNKILRASANLLNKAKPVLFFEYDPYFLEKQNEQPTTIFSVLQSSGYKTLILFDNLGNLLCEADIDNERLLQDLTHYYNQKGSAYMDICALHESDTDMVKPIKNLF